MNDITAYSEQSPANQDAIVRRHATMVKRIAHHVAAKLPSSVQIDDLIQAGMMGLLDAAKNFDASKGASFETYAGIRVRGTMLDEVRRNDWLPRSVYKNSRLISEAVREVESQAGRDAKDHEVAAKMELSIPEYQKMLRETNSGQIYGFDDLGLTDDTFDDGFNARIPTPLENISRDSFMKDLANCIAGLPERERLVLSLYYDEEMNLKEIGEILGVSESRVCQIHSQAAARIRSRMPE